MDKFPLPWKSETNTMKNKDPNEISVRAELAQKLCLHCHLHHLRFSSLLAATWMGQPSATEGIREVQLISGAHVLTNKWLIILFRNMTITNLSDESNGPWFPNFRS